MKISLSLHLEQTVGTDPELELFDGEVEEESSNEYLKYTEIYMEDIFRLSEFFRLFYSFSSCRWSQFLQRRSGWRPSRIPWRKDAPSFPNQFPSSSRRDPRSTRAKYKLINKYLQKLKSIKAFVYKQFVSIFLFKIKSIASIDNWNMAHQ